MNWIGWVMTVLLLAGVVYLPVERAVRLGRVRDGARAQTATRRAAFVCRGAGADGTGKGRAGGADRGG